MLEYALNACTGLNTDHENLMQQIERRLHAYHERLSAEMRDEKHDTPPAPRGGGGGGMLVVAQRADEPTLQIAVPARDPDRQHTRHTGQTRGPGGVGAQGSGGLGGEDAPEVPPPIVLVDKVDLDSPAAQAVFYLYSTYLCFNRYRYMLAERELCRSERRHI